MTFREEGGEVQYNNFINSYIDKTGLIKIELKDNFNTSFLTVGQTEGLKLKHYIETQLKKYRIKNISNIIPSDYTDSYKCLLKDEIIETLNDIKILRIYIDGLNYFMNSNTLYCKKICKELWIGIDKSNIFMLYITDNIDINSYKEKSVLKKINDKLLRYTRGILEQRLLDSTKLSLDVLYKKQD